MTITDTDIRATFTTYLDHHPDDAAALTEPLALPDQGPNFGGYGIGSSSGWARWAT
ncbi:hypothetical protein [Amycolatopsis sp. MJM2582]|uniref:hypothetical protein n=1 Tax=Amycolatopsis sp. MJM2582 TaxID=1427749 RepID=UPI000AAA830A|nr:hypothetical protein [Amycolatopsis sp. MJM2582]